MKPSGIFSKENDGNEIENAWLPLNERKETIYKVFQAIENFIEKYVMPIIVFGGVAWAFWMVWSVFNS